MDIGMLSICDLEPMDLEHLSDRELLILNVQRTNILLANMVRQNKRIDGLEQKWFYTMLMFVAAIAAGLMNGEIAGEVIKAIK